MRIVYCEFCKQAILPDEERMQYGLPQYGKFVHVPGCGERKGIKKKEVKQK